MVFLGIYGKYRMLVYSQKCKIWEVKVAKFWDWDWCASLQCVIDNPILYWNTKNIKSYKTVNMTYHANVS